MNPLLHYILFGKKEGRNAFGNNSKSNGIQDLKFFIYAPPFDENSGCNIVLHRLCDLLNKQGERAYIWLWGGQSQPHKSGICERFNTPFAKLSDLSDNTIVVYPEVVSGNPLKAKNVVRWLLYTAPIVKTFFLVFLFLLIHIYLYSLSGGSGGMCPPHLAPLIHAAFSKYSL